MNPPDPALQEGVLAFGLNVTEVLQFFVVPFVSAIGAGFLTYFLTRRRDRENFQLRLQEEAEIASRQIRRERLLSAYRALDATEPQRIEYGGVTVHGKDEDELYRQRVAALTDLGLFGDEWLTGQIKEIANKGPAYNTSELMNNLRDLLRVEFGLKVTDARYHWIDARKTPPAEESLK